MSMPLTQCIAQTFTDARFSLPLPLSRSFFSWLDGDFSVSSNIEELREAAAKEDVFES